MTTAETLHPRAAGRPHGLPIALAIIAFLVLGVGAWAYLKTRPEASVAVRRDIIAYIPLDGQVVAPPRAQAQVFSPYATTVKKVATTLNARVDKGDLLVELALPAVDAAVASAQQSVDRARQEFENADKTADQALLSTRQRLEAARVAERNLRAAVQSGDAASAVSLEQASQERRAAEQALVQGEYDKNETLEPYRQSLQWALESLKEARSGRLQGLVRAPISGTVVALNARDGEAAGDRPEVPLVTIINLDRLQVQSPVAPEDVGHADVGTPVSLQFEKLPNQIFDGMILRLTTSADDKGRVTSYVAVIGFNNRDSVVMPAQKARASIRRGAVKNVVAVPTEAVDMGEGNQAIVEVNRNGQWVKQPVKIGLSDGDYTEIREGIREGDAIRVTPSLTGRG